MTDVSEEHIVSILRVEETGSAKPASKHVVSRNNIPTHTIKMLDILKQCP
jgi:hypothetical protein